VQVTPTGNQKHNLLKQFYNAIFVVLGHAAVSSFSRRAKMQHTDDIAL
jgi:hypothetical protein